MTKQSRDLSKLQKKLGFDSRELEWYLECEGKTLEDFVIWSDSK